MLCSIPFDWFARTIVESHISFFVINALPVPALEPGSQVRQSIVRAAARLAAVDARYDEWAAAVGVDVASVKSETEAQDLIAEIDALVATGFGLGRDQVVHIYETLHRGSDYESRLHAVLNHFDSIAQEAA